MCLPASFLAPLSWCWHSVRKGLGSRRYLVVLKLCSISSTHKQLYLSLSRKQKVQGRSVQDWQGDSLPLHHQGSPCVCSAHVYKHAFREASCWEAKHHGKKPHIKKNKAWVAGWGEEECKLQESFSLTSSVGSSPECCCPTGAHMKGWKKRRLPKTEAERGQEGRARVRH